MVRYLLRFTPPLQPLFALILVVVGSRKYLYWSLEQLVRMADLWQLREHILQLQ